MQADIALLLDVQSVSRELRHQRERVAACTRRLAELEKAREAAKRQVERLEHELEQTRKGLREGETELRAVEEKLAALKRRSGEVRTSKEYEAVEHELATIEKRRSELDDRLLALMERQEQLQSLIPVRRAELEERLQEIARESERLAVARADAEKLVEGLATDERRLLGQLSDELHDIYMRLLEKQTMPIVVPVRDSGCPGCGTVVPVATIQMLKLTGEVMLCPQCRRLLYYDKAASSKQGTESATDDD
jgi:predicted  nucleic acid-binding Zn-ribbon protein